MASRSRRSEVVIERQRYYWPETQLHVWIIIMLAAAGTVLGTNAIFTQVQQRFGLGIPWIMPYGITVGTLTVIFIIIMLALIAQRRLLPGVVIVGSFVLLVLYVTGAIETGIQLFSPGRINSQCNNLNNLPETTGSTSVYVYIYLYESYLCDNWRAAFSFWIVGAVLLLWIHIMAFQVNRNQYN